MPATIQVSINGESKNIPAASSVEDLLTLLELKGDRVAVELNRHIVRREEWADTQLRDSDRLEIVHFVGGG